MNNKLNQQQFYQLLHRTIPARLPTLVVSAPGIGKSTIYRQVADNLNHNMVVLHPATLDPVDVSGMPVPFTDADGTKKVSRILDDLLSSVFDTTEPTVLLLDELGQASPAMQAACAPILLDRRVGTHKLPDNVSVCAATNSRQHRAGASNILTHLISRMACVVEMSCDLDSWLPWAVSSRQRPEVISFLKFRPGLLLDFDAEKAYSDIQPYPTPRSWENLSKLLNARIDRDIETMVWAGCVGPGAASEFGTHMNVCRQLPDIDEVLKNPGSFAMPESANARWAVATGIALRCNPKYRSNVLEICNQMHRQKMSEFACVALKFSLIADAGLSSSMEWMRFAQSSPVAKLIMKV